MKSYLVESKDIHKNRDYQAAKSLDFICSQASVWAEEALTEREIEMADAKAAAILDHLNTAHNINEEGKIAAGKQRGAEAARAFEEAWKHAGQSA